MKKWHRKLATVARKIEPGKVGRDGVMVVRLGLSLLVLVLGLIPGAVRSDGGTPMPRIRPVMVQAQMRLARQPERTVVAWLRRQRTVAWATMDRGAVHIDFRSGLQAQILPADHLRSLPARRVRLAPLAPRGQSLPSAPLGAGRRALLLFPFAADLDVEAHANAVQAELRAAGFSVDRLDGSAVTVGTMASMTHYDLVYDVTHSSSNQYGEAIIATGEVANPDNVVPAYVPLINEQSLIITGVAGTTTQYYGVRTRFIRDHLDGRFPLHALLFFNGCNLTGSSYLWRFLSEHGASTEVAWDNDVLTLDYAPTGDAFFKLMLAGNTVGETLDAMHAANEGYSYWAGVRATLKYLGDSTLTLDGRSSATPTPLPTATPTPVPTATPLPTATPIPTPVPTATPLPTVTPIPTPLVVHLAHKVQAGRTQTITVSTGPDETVRMVLGLPGGKKKRATRITGPRGQTHWRYRQPGVPPGQRPVAVITVMVGGVSVTRKYRVLP